MECSLWGLGLAQHGWFWRNSPSGGDWLSLLVRYRGGPQGSRGKQNHYPVLTGLTLQVERSQEVINCKAQLFVEWWTPCRPALSSVVVHRHITENTAVSLLTITCSPPHTLCSFSALGTGAGRRSQCIICCMDLCFSAGEKEVDSQAQPRLCHVLAARL